ncbi:pentapeptide repeat-containing protein [Floridanema evergladense]|uniref:Pentapeptide repeat-containing protein n=1 Tax=Floridaenema evergladense BLCC-F167 TaxID=3153639 RepID=A0ABV4WMD6_9CYAN
MEIEELLSSYANGERNFAAINICEAQLSGVNLSGAILTKANLSLANLSRANLSKSDLSYAKLNVTRLSGANLSEAKLNYAILNVANLILANLGDAELVEAALIRAELIRAELSRANLTGANLSNANLREAKLRQSNLSRSNLSSADLRGASLIAANLEGANLQGADLSRADLSSANATNAEFKQANLSFCNLSGANLSGTNLRWVDLRGANLRWVDLSDAKLSGANLTGADLSNTNLHNASFVHADLREAKLMNADWTDANLSGANLTGAKLHSVSRFGLKTEGIICEWLDLSPDGDRTQIRRLSPDEVRKFFHQTLPTIQIIIDAPLDHESHINLATAYYEIAQKYSPLSQPPTIKLSHRRTMLTFAMENDNQLFSAAFAAILPFVDSEATQRNLVRFLQILQEENLNILQEKEKAKIKNIAEFLTAELSQTFQIKLMKSALNIHKKLQFFHAPTQTVLCNSSDQTLPVYNHPNFGKHWVKSANFVDPDEITAIESTKYTLPETSIISNFVKNFTHN